MKKQRKNLKARNARRGKGQTVSRNRFPRGWDEARVRSVIEHYENQTEDEAVAEYEAAFEAEGQTVMIVPTELVPEIGRLIARRERAKEHDDDSVT